MNKNIDARKLDLAAWKAWTETLGLETLFVTVSGSHIYGFPSVDSDIDLRGSHRLPLEKIVGLSKPNETRDFMAEHLDIEVDLVSHDVGKYLGLLVKNNGYILEQVFSPLVISGHEFLDRLRPVAKNCITRNHYYHYRGFYSTQRKLIEKQTPVTSKAILYAYRVLCTGIRLMNTGEVVTDLNQLSEEMDLEFIPELIEAKTNEKIEFQFDLSEHLMRLDNLEEKLEQAFADSNLQENPERELVNQLLLDVRLGN